MKSIKAILGGTAIAVGLGLASFAPAPAQAQSIVDIARVIVGVNDIVYRGGVPYYRYGSYRPQDRIIVVREGGQRRYYRNVPRGNAYGYYGHPQQSNKYKTKHSKNRYYSRDRDGRYDRDGRWDRDDRNDDHRDHGSHGRGH